MEDKTIKQILLENLEHPKNEDFNNQIVKKLDVKSKKQHPVLFDEKSIMNWFLFISGFVLFFYFLQEPKSNEDAILVASVVCIIPVLLLTFNKIYLLRKMNKLIIVIMCFVGLTSCKTVTRAQFAYAEKIDGIRKLFDSTGLGENYHGSVLIADGENILFQNAYGENQLNEPNKINTQYDLASMGKMFTATAIMQLVERDELSLEQTIGELLPNYPNKKAKEIKVKHLLTHTSGMGDYFGPTFFENEENIKSLNDFLPYFVNDPINFNPGEHMRYSNAGYIVLGLIIEKITGKRYHDYVEENIFKPSGMTKTGPLKGSAGGGLSTVKDLHKFALALQKHKLIGTKALTDMTTDHLGYNYGYGMTLKRFNEYDIYGHNGGAPGIAGELSMVMEEPLIIVTMSNRHPLEGWAQMRTNIQKEFFGNTPEMEKFLNTEEVIKTYKAKGLTEASKLVTRLNNNIVDKNTFHYAEQYANQGKMEKAIEVMKLIVQAYSNEWYPYAFLGDFQLQAGLKEDAIKNYKKSLEINPRNEQVIERLKQLEK
ncbi:MAG: serine hydrolase [Flavobacteriaceae bacterium]|nr:serine hydrolase [Flavobacteriaceae bacterium]